MNEIEKLNFIELALREKNWLLTAQNTKISSDEFYRSHRTSALGEPSYREYILKKLEYILKYTSEENMAIVFKSILLGNGAFRSSDFGSNYYIGKNGDFLRIAVSTGFIKLLTIKGNRYEVD